MTSSSSAPAERSPFAHAVAVPLPGVLLTRELFRNCRLATALGTIVDTALGESVVIQSQSVDAAAGNVAKGLDKFHGGRQVVLVGHSYGGYAALEFTALNPHRIAGLVLISTQCHADSRRVSAHRFAQVVTARTEGVVSMLEGMMSSLLSPTGLADKKVTGAVRDMAAASGGPEVFARQMEACVNRADRREAIMQLGPEVPVLVIAGQKDGLIPTRAVNDIRSVLKRREEAYAPVEVAPWMVVRAAEAGHLVTLEQPDELHAAVVEWTERLRHFQHKRSSSAAEDE